MGDSEQQADRPCCRRQLDSAHVTPATAIMPARVPDLVPTRACSQPISAGSSCEPPPCNQESRPIDMPTNLRDTRKRVHSRHGARSPKGHWTACSSNIAQVSRRSGSADGHDPPQRNDDRAGWARNSHAFGMNAAPNWSTMLSSRSGHRPETVRRFLDSPCGNQLVPSRRPYARKHPYSAGDGLRRKPCPWPEISDFRPDRAAAIWMTICAEGSTLRARHSRVSAGQMARMSAQRGDRRRQAD